MTRDPVTDETYWDVMHRDAGCVAATLGEPSRCSGRLTLDHVRGQPAIGSLEVNNEGGYGRRAPSDAAHLVTLCWHHHLDGWATSHRPELRDYLRTKS